MPEVSDYRDWSPAAQQKALERLRELSNDRWRPFYCPVADCDGLPHGDWQWSHARKDQKPPTDDDWFAHLILAGRGAGKTESGSRCTHKIVEHVPLIVIMAPTAADLRDTVVEGPSGILVTSPPGKRPHFEPSKRRLTWPNGARALLLSAEEPDRLRGANSYWAWLDESAFYPLIDDVWSNLLLGLRLGQRPRVMITTTPKPRPWLKDLMADPSTRITRASTYDNLHNLAPTFAEKIIKQYEGTRIGRQELHAEVLTDVEGALWTWEMLEPCRVPHGPDHYDRIVVAVDPAVTANKNSDETGIMVVGISGGIIYIIADHTGKYTPNGWARIVGNLYDEYSADAVVVETNQGGDLVKQNLRTSGITARIIEIHAYRGKALRAEPVVGLYEQKRVKHVGDLSALENEMTEWDPMDKKAKSPNRIDAAVYGVTHVSSGAARANIASPAHLKLIQGGRGNTPWRAA